MLLLTLDLLPPKFTLGSPIPGGLILTGSCALLPRPSLFFLPDMQAPQGAPVAVGFPGQKRGALVLLLAICM